MKADELRAVQAPLKTAYRDDPSAGKITLSARAKLDMNDIVCKLETGKAMVEAGLHPAAGGSGAAACSGDMLLEALVACAGVTLNAVATSLGIPLKSGTVSAEGDLDFRGTLGVSKEVPVGFSDIRLRFDLETEASAEQVATLVKLTERYCVIYQTLRTPPRVVVSTGVATSS